MRVSAESISLTEVPGHWHAEPFGRAQGSLGEEPALNTLGLRFLTALGMGMAQQVSDLWMSAGSPVLGDCQRAISG